MLSFYLSMLEADEDKNKFEELYMKYRDDMYNIAFSILHNCEDAEDAVHDTFVSIANNFEKINKIPCQEIGYYFVIIVRNVSINLYNGNKRRNKYCEEFDDFKTSVDANVFEKFDYQMLVEKISELPAIYRDIIYLYYYEELTAKEISKILKITPETVWKRAERAKKLLKETLEKGEQYAK
jgi:RNA polymerase sigma-70 factor (ECF subfamily)